MTLFSGKCVAIAYCEGMDEPACPNNFAFVITSISMYYLIGVYKLEANLDSTDQTVTDTFVIAVCKLTVAWLSYLYYVFFRSLLCRYFENIICSIFYR